MKPGNAGGAKGPQFGHVDGKDKGNAIGFGLATKESQASRKQLYGQAKIASRGANVGLMVKSVREPDAVNLHVRFDEREVETEHGKRLLRHRRGNPEMELCRSLTHRATSRLYRVLLPSYSRPTRALLQIMPEKVPKRRGKQRIPRPQTPRRRNFAAAAAITTAM